MARLPVRFAALSLTLLAGLIGCGDSTRVTVVGKVTYNGVPLDKPNGTILFVGPDGTEVTAPIESDGTYQAIGVARGENKVAVYYPNPNARTVHTDKGHMPKPGKTPKPPVTGNTDPFLTPIAYARLDTSNLSVVVDKDTTYDPALTGPPIK